MIDDIVAYLRERYGEGWTTDDESNLNFSLQLERVLTELDGLYLIGEPDISEDGIVLNIWVDQPIPDLMTADMLAYDVFGRISGEIFFTERRLEPRTLRYPFVTGSEHRGHIGSLVLAGPHAADFADRVQLRTVGGPRFHA